MSWAENTTAEEGDLIPPPGNERNTAERAVIRCQDPSFVLATKDIVKPTWEAGRNRIEANETALRLVGSGAMVLFRWPPQAASYIRRNI